MYNCQLFFSIEIGIYQLNLSCNLRRRFGISDIAFERPQHASCLHQVDTQDSHKDSITQTNESKYENSTDIPNISVLFLVAC